MSIDWVRACKCSSLLQLDELYAQSPAEDRRQLWEYLFDGYCRRFVDLLAADLSAGQTIRLDAYLSDADESRIPAHYRAYLQGRLRRLIACLNGSPVAAPPRDDRLFVEDEEFSVFFPEALAKLSTAASLSLPLLLVAVGSPNEGLGFSLKLDWFESAQPALLPSAEMLTVSLDSQFADVIGEAASRVRSSGAPIAVYWSITGSGAKRRDLTRFEGRSAAAAFYTGVDIILNSL